ncbi:hypothetical protein M0R72_02400 [Candidatus Pacearchaeota archaeon]|jgi:hypothetical protein|nr:hypothetical protein [Candidatus Pacearchaeota archaeon]
MSLLDSITDLADQSFHTAQGAVNGSLADPPGFSSLAPLPPSSGNQLRQNQVPNYRLANSVRNMVRWFLPELGVVEMYVNPQSIKYTDTKHIGAPVRTRGGYMVQYWGEELGKVSISGTTGSSGVEGINVIYDIYRNEQVALDPIALAVDAARDQAATQSMNPLQSIDILGGVTKAIGVGVNSLFDQVNNVIKTGNVDPLTPKPTLASIAFQTELYWSGWVFRGYFTSMFVNESADKLGQFDYGLEFTVTQKRGLRLNFMPWHRSAVNGPSNSDPSFGAPYSFSTLKDPYPKRAISVEQQSIFTTTLRSLDRALQSSRPL